ncbi:hypothetical protein RQP46_004869 [Phenoliferia psychrophenolica]
MHSSLSPAEDRVSSPELELERELDTETEAVPDSEDGGEDEPTPGVEAPAMVASTSQSDLSELASSVKSLSPPIQLRHRRRPARPTETAPAAQSASTSAGKKKAPSSQSTSGGGGRAQGKSGSVTSDMKRTASRSTAGSGGDEMDDDDEGGAGRDQSESEEEALAWSRTPAFGRRPPLGQRQASNAGPSKGKAVALPPTQRERVSESRSPGSTLTGATDSDEPDEPVAPVPASIGHDNAAEGTSSESSDSEPEAPSFPATKPSTSSLRGRGRPRGGIKRGSVNSRVATTSGHTSETKKRGRGGANGSAFKGRAKPPGSPFDVGSPGVRATRATVTLPPGYIEGVKSARMTRPRSASSTPVPRATPQATAEPEELEPDIQPSPASQPSPQPAPPPQYQPQAIKGRKGFKGKEKEVVKEEEELVEVELATVVKEEDEVVSPPEPQTREGTPREATPAKEKGTPMKEKGKDRAFTYEPERTLSKRRKVDAEALARSVERAAAKVVLLEQLETEAQKVRDATHPLIDITYTRLEAEKTLRLEQLAKSLEQQERDYDKILHADSQSVWRQWADAKDTLRTDMYLDNQEQLKQLIYEEKAYPFLRDHPLLVNTHGLPPVPFYRGPLSSAAAVVYPPRTDVYTGHTLEPPPFNHAIDHSAWALSANEIEDDMATLADYSAKASAPVPAPPPPPPSRYPANPYSFYEGQQGAPPQPVANGYRPYAAHPFYPPMASAPWSGPYDASPAQPNAQPPSTSLHHSHSFKPPLPSARSFDKPPKHSSHSPSLPSALHPINARHNSSQPATRHDGHATHAHAPTPPASSAVSDAAKAASTIRQKTKSNPGTYGAFPSIGGAPQGSHSPHLPHPPAVSPLLPSMSKAPGLHSRPPAPTPPGAWYTVPNSTYSTGAGAPPAKIAPSWGTDPPRKEPRKEGGSYPYW